MANPETAYEVELTPNRVRVGERMQRTANLLCYFRMLTAAALGISHITAKDPYTWRRTAATGLNYGTDKLDGVLAKAAAELLQRPPLPENKRLDGDSDKVAHGSHAIGQTARAFIEGWKTYGFVRGVNFGAQAYRDTVVGRKRTIAQHIAEQTGHDIHVGSTPSSRYKLGVTAVADTTGESPLVRRRWGRLGVMAVDCAATYMSVTCGAEIINRLDAGIAGAIGTVSDPDLKERLTQLSAPTIHERIVLGAGGFLSSWHTPTAQHIPDSAPHVPTDHQA